METLKNNLPMIIMVVGLICLLGGYPTAYYLSSTETTIMVKRLERIVESSGSGETASTSSKYLVFTNNEVFENTDSWLYLKFSSSDLYSKLKEGQTYKVKVAGWRIPFLSWYRNIISIE